MADQHYRANDMEIGKLLQAVETMSSEIAILRRDVGDLTGKINTGKGMFYGALFAAGGVGAGISQLADRFFS